MSVSVHRMANDLCYVGVVVDAIVIGEGGDRPVPRPMFLPLGSIPTA